MDTGKPALGKRVLSSFFALTLVMGLVPVSAYAEVGKAQEQQGQEQSEQSAAVSGESASQDAASDATQQGACRPVRRTRLLPVVHRARKRA